MAKPITYTLQAADIEVAVERKAVRRVNLRVRPDGTAHMSVPWRVGQAEAQAFLDAHAEWLAAAVGRAAAKKNAEVGPGDGGVPLWGRLATLPEGTDVAELYRAEVARALPEVVVRMEAASGLHATGWQLRDMRTR